MSYHYYGSALGQLAHSLLHPDFVIGVGKCRCFVHYYNRGVFQHYSCYGYSLLFTARKIYAGCAYDSVFSVGEFFYYIHTLRVCKCRHDFLAGSGGSAHKYVFVDSSLYKSAVLEYKGNRIHKCAFRYVLYVASADDHVTLIRIKEAYNKLSERSLAAARRTDKSDCLSRLDPERYIVNYILAFVV